MNAHIYHEEEGERHRPPRKPEDLEARLRLLRGLPLCDCWVLEIREEEALLETLTIVRGFLASKAGKDAARC